MENKPNWIWVTSIDDWLSKNKARIMENKPNWIWVTSIDDWPPKNKARINGK